MTDERFKVVSQLTAELVAIHQTDVKPLFEDFRQFAVELFKELLAAAEAQS